MNYSRIFTLFLIAFFINAGCETFFFFPDKNLRENLLVQKFPYEHVYFKTSDGVTLHGWFFKTPGKSIGTILFFHGNAENISTHINSVLWLIPEDFDVFIFDYRGYGKSEGRPTIKGVHIDAAAALKTLVTFPQTNKDRIFIFGQSIGGAIALYAVANSPYKNLIKALIIEGTFSSYRLIAREKAAALLLTWPFQIPIAYSISDYYSPVKWIGKVSPVPILIMHGSKDKIVPVNHGSILFEQALAPKDLWVLEGKNHIGAFADANVRERLIAYLKKL